MIRGGVVKGAKNSGGTDIPQRTDKTADRHPGNGHPASSLLKHAGRSGAGLRPAGGSTGRHLG